MQDWSPRANIDDLVQRGHDLARIRDFFSQRHVVEVQTPVLGRHTVSEPNVESIQVPGYGYLQTSPEYHMKRLLAAGMPSCYQLGPAFRHEEVGHLHNSEFTILEWYRLGFDHHQLMAEVAQLVDTVLGPDNYSTLSYNELLGPAITNERADNAQLDLAAAMAMDELGPGRFFITDYPPDQAALARLTESGSAARFELVVDGIELANGYWELLDVAEHRRRFAKDQLQRKQRGLSPIEEDYAFLAALKSGLPDCAGVALGVDRLLMMGANAASLDAVLAFR